MHQQKYLPEQPEQYALLMSSTPVELAYLNWSYTSALLGAVPGESPALVLSVKPQESQLPSGQSLCPAGAARQQEHMHICIQSMVTQYTADRICALLSGDVWEIRALHAVRTLMMTVAPTSSFSFCMSSTFLG